MSNKKYIFICRAFPDKEVKDYSCNFKRGFTINQAPEIFQWNVIKGLTENNANFDVMACPCVPSYPQLYSEWKVDYFSYNIDKSSTFYNIGYCTFFVLKDYSMEFNLYRNLSLWCRDNQDKELVAIVYNVDAPLLSAANKVKKKFPNLKISVIITDMIEDAMNFKANRTLLKRVQLSIQKKKIFQSYKQVDYYILLSELMKNRLPNCNEYVIVEGIFAAIDKHEEVKKEKIVVYTGILDTYVNLPELVEAFKNIENKDYKLVICGKGPYSDYLKKVSEEDPRIEFLGVLPREEAIALQKKASLLINPRQPSEITKYSFPSKTIEYFLSATPTLMYKLEGIPSEYYKYCFTIDGYEVRDLINAINNALSHTEEFLIKMGLDARKFVVENKNARTQVTKILELINS